jgi:PLP dependent protein
MEKQLEDAAKKACAAIEQRLAAAARLANRDRHSITLVGASKTVDGAQLRAFIAAGVRHFGENRLQEALAKWPSLKAQFPTVCLHYIGALQSNKVDSVVGLFDVIESIDRPALLSAIAAAMKKQNRVPECLIQVNIGNEPQKAGCAIADLPALLTQATQLGIDVHGLMAIPPAQRQPAPYFALLAKLAQQHGLSKLSMGMSQDFETAIALGATHVRIGTALFGQR